MIALMSGLRDWISHRMGWETYDEAYERIRMEIDARFSSDDGRGASAAR